MPDELPEQPRPTPEPDGPREPAPLVSPPFHVGGPGSPFPNREPSNAPEEVATTRHLIEQLERLRRSRVLVYWTSPMARMADGSVPSLYDQLMEIGEVEHLDLALHTFGGDVEIPWRMVSLIREFAKRFSVLIPHRAASAGTLLALGADEIVMTRYAVLGPIDPSRTHPLLPRREGEPAEQVSVQDMRHAMQFIREAGRVDSEFVYTPEAMAQIFTALFDKLHPLAIGAIEQSYALSKLIGTRCLETHMKGANAKREINRIVDQLCDEYKSHAYQIPRREAQAIGLKVRPATKRVEEVLMRLYRHCSARPLTPPTPPTGGVPFKSHIAWLDSSTMNLRCEADQVFDPSTGKSRMLGDRWVGY